MFLEPAPNPHHHGGGLDVKSCPTLATARTVAHQAPLSMGFFRQEYWSWLHFFLQGIFLIQGANPGLLHCRQILYPLSYEGSPSNSWILFKVSIFAHKVIKIKTRWWVSVCVCVCVCVCVWCVRIFAACQIFICINYVCKVFNFSFWRKDNNCFNYQRFPLK